MAATLPSPRRPRFLADVPESREPKPASFARVGDKGGAPAPVAAPVAAAPPAPTRLPERGPTELRSAPPPSGLEALGAAVEALRLLSSKLAEQARGDALEIAFQIARRILEAELSASPQPLFALVRSAVRRVGEARAITLRLSPQDAALVEARPREDLGLSLAKVTVVADPTLERGDCLVESELGDVDGRLGARLSEVQRSLDEALAGDAA